ncbi:neither inactivation nor afterpotential protein G-like [Diaphorina citri]|uniref:Neither inactivation nor afterpotential protein G-like n=1 Tax=Diaphorina citri TaxID=121845 RepID=A0A3Q0J359_DIACI|nr:neither inactivation nor afterpotential protein G-like [Diaphorina citri]
MPLYVSTDVATVSLASALSSDNIWNYVRRGEGSFNFSSVAGVGSVDGRLGFLAVGIKPDRSALLTQIANYKDETFASLFPMDDRHGFVILSQCLKPQSRGYVQKKKKKKKKKIEYRK